MILIGFGVILLFVSHIQFGCSELEQQTLDVLNSARTLYLAEIGCKPKAGDSGFDCPKFKEVFSSDKCYFNGKEYDIDARLESNETYGMCVAACFCKNPPKFTCAHIDCPEFFGRGTSGPDCVLKREPGKCCSVGEICGEEKAKTHKCVYDGADYYDGSTIYPKGSCYSCTCSRAFDQSVAFEINPSCKKTECNTRFYHTNEIREGCAPVFYKNTCCPIEYRCPSNDDKVVSEGRSEEGFCTFGNLSIGVGGELNSVEGKGICKCVVPPQVECFRDGS